MVQDLWPVTGPVAKGGGYSKDYNGEPAGDSGSDYAEDYAEDKDFSAAKKGEPFYFTFS